MHTQHLYLESHCRRENLKFFGIPEKEASASEGKDAVGTTDVLCGFLHNVLGFGDPKRIMEFQRVHRIGKSVPGKPRPILARFLRYQDCETVLRAGFGLKDTEYMILQDFPQEIIERKRKQMPKLKEPKKRAKKHPLANPNRINSLLTASSFLRKGYIICNLYLLQQGCKVSLFGYCIL